MPPKIKGVDLVGSSWVYGNKIHKVHLWGREAIPNEAGLSQKKSGMYVYILYSSSLNKFYVGQTADFNTRLNRHNKGLVNFTSRGVPWKRVWLKEVENRSEAVLLERKIKGRGAKRYLNDLGVNYKLY